MRDIRMGETISKAPTNGSVFGQNRINIPNVIQTSKPAATQAAAKPTTASIPTSVPKPLAKPNVSNQTPHNFFSQNFARPTATVQPQNIRSNNVRLPTASTQPANNATPAPLSFINQSWRDALANAIKTTPATNKVKQVKRPIKAQQIAAARLEAAAAGGGGGGSAASNSKKKPENANESIIPDHDRPEDQFGIAETYAEYKPSKLESGKPHPDSVVETATLSSVAPPDITYKWAIPDAVIKKGLLSALQLESIVYASQAHGHMLPDKTRAGFLIGK